MIVVDPIEKGDRVIQLFRVDRRRRFLEAVARRDDALHHRLPVVDGGPHLSEDMREVLFDLAQRLGRALLVDLNLHEGFARARLLGLPDRGDVEQRPLLVALDHEDRMDDEMNHQVHRVQPHRHGVHKEGHVVVDDLDHGVARPPAVLVEPGIVCADLEHAAGTLDRELEQRQRRAVEVFRLDALDVVGENTGVKFANEQLGVRGLLARQLGAHELRRFLDLFVLVRFHPRSHRLNPRRQILSQILRARRLEILMRPRFHYPSPTINVSLRSMCSRPVNLPHPGRKKHDGGTAGCRRPQTVNSRTWRVRRRLCRACPAGSARPRLRPVPLRRSIPVRPLPGRSPWA